MVVSRPRKSGSQGREHPLYSSPLTLGSCFLVVDLHLSLWGHDPPSRCRSLVTGSQALRWGEGLDSQPTPTASTFLCSCVFSPPPIWLPPSPLQELSLPTTLLLATLRSVPLNLLGLPLTPAFLAPCATHHSCPPPVSAGLPAPLWPLPGPTWLGALVLLFLGHPGSGL